MSNSLDNRIVKMKEIKAMSFATIVFFGEFAIMAADTRSTVKHNEGRDQVCDECQKIARIPDTNIIITSTGINNFDGKNLSQIAAEVSANSVLTVCEELTRIVQHTLPNNKKTLFIVTEYANNNWECVTHELTNEAKHTIPDYFSCNSLNYHCIGQHWAIELLNYTDFSIYMQSQKGAIKALREYFKSLMSISNFMRDDYGTIGGDVEMVLLKPGKEPEFLGKAD
jgi:hypothetical protein